jgi:hypothetical protein
MILIESIKAGLNENELRLFEYKIMCYESSQIAYEMGITYSAYRKRYSRLTEKLKELGFG